MDNGQKPLGIPTVSTDLRVMVIGAERYILSGIRQDLKRFGIRIENNIVFARNVPESLPLVRDTAPDLVFLTYDEKYAAHTAFFEHFPPSARQFATVVMVMPHTDAPPPTMFLHLQDILLNQEAAGCYVVGLSNNKHMAGILERAANHIQRRLLEAAAGTITDKPCAASRNEQSSAGRLRVMRRNGAVWIDVPLEDVEYIGLQANYVSIVHPSLPNNQTILRKNLLPKQLSHLLVRVHRSFYVNILHIKEASPITMVTRSGQQIPVSDAGYKRYCDAIMLRRPD